MKTAGFQRSPSPHLTPSYLLYQPKKRCVKTRFVPLKWNLFLLTIEAHKEVISMKKHIRILATALLICSLSACANVEKPEIPESNSTQVMSAVSSAVERPASSSESKKAAVSSKAPAAPTERPKSTSKPAEKEKEKQPVQKEDSPSVHTTEPPKQANSTPKPQPKVQAASTPAPTPVPTPVPPPVQQLYLQMFIRGSH